MSWQINKIFNEMIPNIVKQLEIDVRNGNPNIENIRCIYTTDDTNIPHILTVFDFVDLDPPPEIKTLSLGQMVKK